MDTLQNILNLGVAGLAVYLFYALSVHAISNNTRALNELVAIMRHLEHHIKPKN